MAKQLSAQNLIEPAPSDEEYVCASARAVLEHARSHVERATNSTMVEAYEDNMALLSGVPNLRHAMS